MRLGSVRFIGACIVTALLAGCASDTINMDRGIVSTTSDAAEFASLVSAYRVSKGLSPVTVDSKLNQAAEYQARAVAAAGMLSHGDFAGRMEKFAVLGEAAENLSAGAQSPSHVLARWQASRYHNQNMLMPRARKIGFARAEANTRYGRYWAMVVSD